MATKRKSVKDTTSKQREKVPGGITGKGFVKGDPRINRNGRPKNFDEVRSLFKDIAGEKLGDSDMTRIESMGLLMSTSRNPRDRELFLQYGFGKVKDEIEIDDKSLTDDERANRIAEILDAARARQAGQADTDKPASGG